MDERRMRQLKWRCRRGLLENDLVLERFLDRHGADLAGADLEAFTRLLELDDNRLWELVCGRAQPSDPELANIVRMLREC